MFDRLRDIVEIFEGAAEADLDGSIGSLVVESVLVAQLCGLVVLLLEVVIADFDVVSSIDGTVHRVETLVLRGTADRCGVVGVPTFSRLCRVRSFWRSLFCFPAPAEDTDLIGQWVLVARVLLRLLLVNFADDLVHGATGRTGAGCGSGLRGHAGAQENDGDHDAHRNIVAPGAGETLCATG